MVNIKRFVVNPVQENTYVVWDDTRDCVIVDCGCIDEYEWRSVSEFIKKERLRPVHLLNTHLHFDHILGVEFAHRDYGIAPEASDADLNLYNSVQRQLMLFMGMTIDGLSLPALSVALGDGDKVSFGRSSFTVLATPGHTPGGVCFYDEADKILFSGDTIFRESVGRTDFEGGNHRVLQESIMDKIMPLPADVTIYPGHGPETTVGHERDCNPYF